MINPPKKIEPPTKTEQAQMVIVKTGRAVRAERDLVIAAVFLVIGFLMGQF